MPDETVLVDDQQKLALFNERAVLEEPLFEKTLDPRQDVDGHHGRAVPVASRYSVTARWTGRTTVTLGGGGSTYWSDSAQLAMPITNKMRF